ncbi:MAG: hypothetical protein JNK33_06925, partial [Candidatus Doudnabacteria bacterium]|nr:hypothetical protein [Candidatus Doudnabacteria bacterium]
LNDLMPDAHRVFLRTLERYVVLGDYCFVHAGIDPKRTTKSLRLTEVAKLRKSLCSVLERGLATGGASDNTYRDFYGGRGGYQNEFLTYGRTGEPCNNCGLALKRIVVGGRGTWVCEKCQK